MISNTHIAIANTSEVQNTPNIGRVPGHRMMEHLNNIFLPNNEVLEELEGFQSSWYKTHDMALDSLIDAAKASGGNLISIAASETMRCFGQTYHSIKGSAGLYSVPKVIEPHEVDEYNLNIINAGNRFSTKFRLEAKRSQALKLRQEMLIRGGLLCAKLMVLAGIVMTLGAVWMKF